ncbi:hypothetical protein [Methanothermobacter tenebrarum]
MKFDETHNMKTIVTGDITIDWIQWPIKSHEIADYSENWKTHIGFHRKALEGGALLLAKMLKELVPRVEHPQILSKLENTSPEEFIHSFADLELYNGKYLIKSFLGYTGPEEGLPKLPFKFKDRKADIIVIDDAGNGFRELEDKWPSSIIEDKPLIILKMSAPLFEGKLWHHLKENHEENLVVIITVDDLREMGANISRRLSWERTAEDFIWQIHHNPLLAQLKELKHLIVRINLEGAIYYKAGSKAKLFYHPQLFEGNLKEQSPGRMQGHGCAFTAAFTAALQRGLEIERGIIEGIKASQRLLDEGFGSKPDYPTKEIFYNGEEANIGTVEIPPLERLEGWTIATSPPHFDIKSVSEHIVIEGYKERKYPLPIAHFGKLITADRTEIEGYQSIRNIIIEYLKNERVERPLSIGVFGPPGAGKSFAVSQLAASVDPKKIKTLNFNVSQFREENDLIDAFHQIRDAVLKGKIPQAFFDEFDSPYKGKKLGWIKYFLAPMQDGEFREGDTTHPLGKSILIFAGGTSNTFEEFESQDKKLLKGAKVRDFISRLRGYVNIIGPDPMDKKDRFYILRRAILLRSLFERKTPHLLDGRGKLRIDQGVLKAFLMIPSYKHGVRSMEAILEMSLLEDVKKFEKASLPPASQLDLHVDGKLFHKLVTR